MPKYLPVEDLPRTRAALRRLMHASWLRGVWAAADRLENEADRVERSDARQGWALREAAELLDGVARRGR